MRSRGPALPPRALSARDEAATPAEAPPAGWGVLEAFVVSQTLLPALLFLPGTQAIRTPLRVAPFMVSLALLAWAAMRGGAPRIPHPARGALALAIVTLGLMILHPDTSTLVGGVAAVGLYVSVMAPVFWVPAFARDARQLTRLLAILLVCNGLNAVVGVLQVYDPGTWMPGEFSRVITTQALGIETVSYTGRDGYRVVRPPGLFDNPGAVCMPAMAAAVLGLVFFLSPITGWKRVAALLLAFAGGAAIYLSFVRTILLVVVGVAGVYVGALVLQKRTALAGAFGAAFAAIIAGSLIVAINLGGESVLDRFATVVEDDPIEFYYEAGRGSQIEDFVSFLGEYPLGAGLARWGMVNVYFGSSGKEGTSIWAELQPNAWVIDGGIALVVLYGTALLLTVRHELRLVRTATDPHVKHWGPVILALNAGIVAIVFGGTPFASQGGMQYWFLAGLLHAVAATAAPPVTAPAPVRRADARLRPR
jgi:hypothetical protein